MEAGEVYGASLVSVIIPTINRPTLERAVNSVACQSYANIELILVGDGCLPRLDPTVAMKVSQCRTIEFPKSGRPAPLRNYGLKIARGDFVAFLDDDDEWDHDKVQKQLSVMALKNPLAVTSNAEFGPIEDHHLYFDKRPSISIASTILQNPFILSSLLVNKVLLPDGAEFPEHQKYRGFEDHLFELYLQLHGDVMFIDDPLVTYHTETDDRLSDQIRQRAWHNRRTTVLWVLKTLCVVRPKGWGFKFAQVAGLLPLVTAGQFVPSWIQSRVKNFSTVHSSSVRKRA